MSARLAGGGWVNGENNKFMAHINDGCNTEVLSLPFGSLSAIKLVYEAHKSLQNGYGNTNHFYGQ